MTSNHPAEIAADAVETRQRVKNPHPLPDTPPVTERIKATEEGSGTPEGSSQVERPSTKAVKPEWVDYAVALGEDRAEAEEMTKAELIALYGDE